MIYNQQNGQPTTNFALSSASAVSEGGNLFGFYTFAANEINVPSNTASQDAFAFNIVNSTAGIPQRLCSAELLYGRNAQQRDLL